MQNVFNFKHGDDIMIKNYNELSSAEKQTLYDFISAKRNGNIQNFIDFGCTISGNIYNKGEDFLIYIEGANIVGCLGVITREISIRGEAFINIFYVKDNNASIARLLINSSLLICSRFDFPTIRIGLNHSSFELTSTVIEAGFRECYKLLSLSLDKSDYDKNKYANNLCLEPINIHNKDTYINLHNTAFLNSPNGSSIDITELTALLKGYKSKTDLVGIAIKGDLPIGIYELDMMKDIGFINTIGLHPDYWHRGLGKSLMGGCIDKLIEKGAKKINLNVMSSNERAYSLYSELGFQMESTVSIWFSNTER